MRVGAGRVDARAALGNQVLAATVDPLPVISAYFGVPEVANKTLKSTRTIELTNTGGTPVTYDVSIDLRTDMPGVKFTLNKSSVTVPGHATRTVKVIMRATRNKLRKVWDPTITATFFGAAGQRLAEESGLVVFEPTAGADYTLRVPVYAAPKPMAAIKVPTSLEVDGPDGTGLLGLTGRAVGQGSLGDDAYLSLYSVMQLGGLSPQLALCKDVATTNCALNRTGRGGDLHYVGAGSSAPQANADGHPEDSQIWFGFGMWKSWVNLGVNTIPFVDIDTDGDDIPDYETFILRDLDTDLLEAWTVSLGSGFPLVDIEPVNFLYGDIDTNTYDNNVIVAPVYLDALGIDPTDASHRISYFAGVDGYYEAPDDTLVDFIPDLISYDPLAPGLWAEGAEAGGVFIATPGEGMLIHRNAASLALDPYDDLLTFVFDNKGSQGAWRATVTNVTVAAP